MSVSGTAKTHLADSSAWVFLFRRPQRPRLHSRFQGLVGDETLATCDMVRLELLRMARDDSEYAQMNERLRAAVLLPTNARVWDEAIGLGRRLKRAGVGLEPQDLVIAAVALVHDVILVHADGDFERVAQHSDLQTEPVFDLLSPSP